MAPPKSGGPTPLYSAVACSAPTARHRQALALHVRLRLYSRQEHPLPSADPAARCCCSRAAALRPVRLWKRLGRHPALGPPTPSLRSIEIKHPQSPLCLPGSVCIRTFSVSRGKPDSTLATPAAAPLSSSRRATSWEGVAIPRRRATETRQVGAGSGCHVDHIPGWMPISRNAMRGGRPRGDVDGGSASARLAARIYSLRVHWCRLSVQPKAGARSCRDAIIHSGCSLLWLAAAALL